MMELIWKLMISTSAIIVLFLVISHIKNNKKIKEEIQIDDISIAKYDDSDWNYNENQKIDESFERLKKQTLTLNKKVFLLKEHYIPWIKPSQMEAQYLKDFNYAKSVYNKILNMNCSKIDAEIKASGDDEFYQGHLIYYRNMFNKDKESYLKYIRDRKDKLYKKYNKVKTGRIGEERVWNTITNFDNCLFLKNKRLEYTDNKKVRGIQMDSIIISSKGLFILEVKNLSPTGEYRVHIDKTGVWRAIYPDGREFIMDENANKQNNMHLATLNKIINESLGTSDYRYIEAKGITVIANNVVKVENESSNQVVLCIDEVYNYINKFDIKYTDEQKQFLYDFIEKNNRPEAPIKTDGLMSEFKEVTKTIENDLEKTLENIRKLMTYGV